MQGRRYRRTRSSACVCTAALAAVATGGCVANSSNPAVKIASAECDGKQALISLELFNPSGRDLTVTSVEYELSHGETHFPVARETWLGAMPLHSHERAVITLLVPFSTEPLEPDSRLLQLRGELVFVDKTGFLGLSSMDLTRTNFDAATVAVLRRSP